MYDLPYFKEHDPNVVKQFIRDHPFAFLCGCDHSHQPVATQVPMFLEERDNKIFLTGHLMRNTDHHKAFEQNPNALVVFTGPSAYVSATWYSDPHQASTWNYISVHAKGTIKFLDENGLVEILHKTTHHFENHNAASTTVLENLPKEYVDKLIKAIVGFEIEVTDLQNVFKLSQNRDEQSYNTIVRKLHEQGGDAAFIADQMKQRADALFRQGRDAEG